MNVIFLFVAEIRSFLQIILIIAVPVLIVASAVVIVFHYWNKKRRAKRDVVLDGDEIVVSPEEFVELPYEDKIKAFYIKPAFLREREQNLKRIEELEQQLMSLQNFSEQLHRTHDSEKQNTVIEMQQKLESLDTKYSGEKEETGKQLSRAMDQVNELTLELGKMNAVIRENESLKESLKEWGNKFHNLQTLYNSREEEVMVLKGKLEQLVHTEEMLTERNNQINFLQKQLEQRTQSLREVEMINYQLTEKMTRMEEEMRSLKDTLSGKESVMMAHQNEVMELKRVIDEKNKYYDDISRQLKDREERLQLSEKSLENTLQKNNSRLLELNDLIADRQEQIHILENKLGAASEVLTTMYREVSRSYSNYSRLLENGNGQTDQKFFLEEIPLKIPVIEPVENGLMDHQ